MWRFPLPTALKTKKRNKVLYLQEVEFVCFLQQFATIVFSNCQQVVRRYILGSVVDSEKNYVDALKRILEVPRRRVAGRHGCPWPFPHTRVYACIRTVT